MPTWLDRGVDRSRRRVCGLSGAASARAAPPHNSVRYVNTLIYMALRMTDQAEHRPHRSTANTVGREPSDKLPPVSDFGHRLGADLGSDPSSSGGNRA
jgi:hypothetical protein